MINGTVELANKNIKKILQKMTEAYRDWHEKLPFALLAYQTTIRPSTSMAQSSFVYSVEVIPSVELEVPSFKILMETRLEEVVWA